MDNLTPIQNTENINYIRRQIERKTSSNPYLANNNTILKTVTDMDHHPYTRWYRGVYYYPDPIVMEREAGYRKLENQCYAVNPPPITEKQPSHCFEAACSIQYPCYPEYLQKFADKEALDIMLNKACIVEYR